MVDKYTDIVYVIIFILALPVIYCSMSGLCMVIKKTRRYFEGLDRTCDYLLNELRIENKTDLIYNYTKFSEIMMFEEFKGYISLQERFFGVDLRRDCQHSMTIEELAYLINKKK